MTEALPPPAEEPPKHPAGLPSELPDSGYMHDNPVDDQRAVRWQRAYAALEAEHELREEFGESAHAAGLGPLADDVVKLRAALARSPEQQNALIHAGLMGREAALERVDEAELSGDPDAFAAAVRDVFLSDLDRFRPLWNEIQKHVSSPANSLESNEGVGDDGVAPEDDPPVNVPRPSPHGDWRG